MRRSTPPATIPMRQDWTVRSICANPNHRVDRNGPFRCRWPKQFTTQSIVGDWQAQLVHVPGQYRYIDLEADTEAMYWLVFHGLLLLYRDAHNGRFAKQRAAGIGGSSTTATSRYPLPVMCTTNLLRQAFRNVVWWNEIKWIIICMDSLLRTVPVHRRRTTFSASRVPEPPFGVGCVKLVWKHHAPTLQIRRG